MRLIILALFAFQAVADDSPSHQIGTRIDQSSTTYRSALLFGNYGLDSKWSLLGGLQFARVDADIGAAEIDLGASGWVIPELLVSIRLIARAEDESLNSSGFLVTGDWRISDYWKGAVDTTLLFDIGATRFSESKFQPEFVQRRFSFGINQQILEYISAQAMLTFYSYTEPLNDNLRSLMGRSISPRGTVTTLAAGFPQRTTTLSIEGWFFERLIRLKPFGTNTRIRQATADRTRTLGVGLGWKPSETWFLEGEFSRSKTDPGDKESLVALTLVFSWK